MKHSGSTTTLDLFKAASAMYFFASSKFLVLSVPAIVWHTARRYVFEDDVAIARNGRDGVESGTRRDFRRLGNMNILVVFSDSQNQGRCTLILFREWSRGLHAANLIVKGHFIIHFFQLCVPFVLSCLS